MSDFIAILLIWLLSGFAYSFVVSTNCHDKGVTTLLNGITIECSVSTTHSEGG